MTNSNCRTNILFVTQEDPFYVKVFFEEFLRNYNNISDIKGLVICNTLGKKSLRQLAMQIYDFYGFGGFIKMSAKFFWQKFMLVVSKIIPTNNSFSLEQLFAEYGVKSQKRNDINSRNFIEEWKPKEIDVIISVASSVIFHKPLLELPRWGCLNIHHAKLPKYRGMMPNFWQMYHNENTAGITIHLINPKIDDGDIVLQGEIEILPGETLDHLIKRSKKVGAGMMIEVISQIRENRVNLTRNESRNSSYYSFPTKKDVQDFRRRGKRII